MSQTHAVTTISGKAVYVPGNDIDTDRIIPAAFLRCVTFDGIGRYAFHDERFDSDGASKGHPLDREECRGAAVLITDGNFGCGSSREHAPQALARFGFQAIVGGSFADIFFGNATNLGVPCVTMPDAERAALARVLEADPGTAVSVDIEAMRVQAGENSFPIDMPANARQSLLAGTYDLLPELLTSRHATRRLAVSLGYVDVTT